MSKISKKRYGSKSGKTRKLKTKLRKTKRGFKKGKKRVTKKRGGQPKTEVTGLEEIKIVEGTEEIPFEKIKMDVGDNDTDSSSEIVTDTSSFIMEDETLNDDTESGTSSTDTLNTIGGRKRKSKGKK